MKILRSTLSALRSRKLTALSCCFFSSFLLATSHAATIILPEMTTTATVPSAGLPVVTSQKSWTVNLSDRTGLTPGLPISIVVTTSAQFLWLLAFNYDTGALVLANAPTLNLPIGAASTTVSGTASQSFPMAEGPGASGHVVGSQLGAMMLEVPWNTDLTQATFTLTQNASIQGTNARLTGSAVTLSTALVPVTSVPFQVVLTSVIPEPSISLLAISGACICLARRRPQSTKAWVSLR